VAAVQRSARFIREVRLFQPEVLDLAANPDQIHQNLLQQPPSYRNASMGSDSPVLGILRGFALTAFLALSTTFPPAAARAQTPFQTITVFGESYADRGNLNCFTINGPANCPYPRQTPFPANPPTDATQIVPFAYQLQQFYGIPNSAASDYAVAGSTAYSGANGLGASNQVDSFVASGRRFGASDLVAVQFIGNDAFNSATVQFITHVPTAFDTGNPLVDARTEAARDVASFQKLVNAGLRNVAWLFPGDAALKPIGQTGDLGAPAVQAFSHAYANAAFDALQAGLAPFAQSGIRIFLFDLRILEQRLNTAPQIYGLSNLSQAFRPDGLHYTAAGFLLIARYMQNQIDAPTTIAPQGDIAMSTATNFANATFGRLDAYRKWSPLSFGSAMPADYRLVTKASPLPAESPWSIYAEGNYASGTHNAQFYESSFNYSAGAGTIGVEYRISPDLLVGGVFAYANPSVNLVTQQTHNDINSYQFGGYASYTSSNWFTDGLLAYGRHVYKIDREGLIDVIHGNTNADTFSAAARGGYLFDASWLRVGPIAGLNYTNVDVQGYTETGDVLITMIVDGQKFDSLTGNVGAQFRYPFWFWTHPYTSFINLTAEHDFIGSARTITTTQVTTPLLPVLTPIGSQGRTYGKIAGGIATAITANTSAMVNAVTTFARAGGNDFGINGGVRVSF
jgi:outer membrane lipase/esterase